MQMQNPYMGMQAMAAGLANQQQVVYFKTIEKL